MAPAAGLIPGGAPAPADDADRRTRLVALALVVGAWLAFVFPAFAGLVRFPVDFAGPAPGQESGALSNPELGDAYYAMYPWHTYLGDRLGDGELPLWDPYRFGGTPFAANIAPAVWYPPNWLYATGHVLFSFTAIAVASMLAALLMAFWFFRLLRLHPYAAALGAIVFAYSAALMRYSANEPVFASSIWLPLALAGVEVARQGRRRRGAVLAAAGLALSVLGGHAQIALCVWLITALWALTGLVASAHHHRRDGRGPLARVLATEAAPVALAFALALALSAVQLLPTAEFAGEIVRQETSFEAARLTALPLAHLPTLLVPDYLGSPLDGNYRGPGVNYTETALYAGLLTLPLAVLGLARRPGRVAAFFLTVTVVGALAVLGTPFYHLVLVLPGFSRTLFMTRFILLVDVGLAGLAAVGLHAALGRPDRRALLAGLASTGALAAVLGWLVVARPGTAVADGYVTGRGLRAMAIVLVGGTVLAAMARYRSVRAPLAAGLVALVFFDLWLYGSRLNAFHTPRPVFARTPAIEALAAVPGPRPRFANIGGWWVPPNGELPYRLYGISGYDPFVPRRIVELMSLADDQRDTAGGNFFGPFRRAAVNSPVLDLLGVATVTGAPGGSLPGPVRFAGSFRAYARPTAFPPAWVAPCWELASPGDVLRRVATMTSAELATTAVVADEGGAGRALGGAPPATTGCGGADEAGQVRIVRYDPERVVMATPGAASGGVLVLSDAWFPGWQARVDGRGVPVLRVDHALRGVALPPGAHTVELSYRPRPLVVGGAVSAATLVGIAAWLARIPLLAAVARRRTRR